ncbi:MAG: PepSY-associated TM helix domain-containing protein [Bacteroidota bacterium]
MKTSFKKKVLWLHKVLGLATGSIVFVVAVTGCCWVFKEEIESLYSSYTKVTPQNKPMVTASKARTIGLTVFPERYIHGTLYKKENDAIEVIFYEADPEFYQSVFINPYSGEVLHVKDHLSGFFGFVLRGHLYLWLPKAIGEQIVSVSIFLFLFILVSGLILWWPKKRKNLKQRLTFNWKPTTRWKRKNFDLHSVIGFYMYSLAFVFAFTGSVLAFNWFYYVVYKSAGGEKAPQFIIPENVSVAAGEDENTLVLDKLVPMLKKESPDAVSYELHYPHSDSTSIYVEVSRQEGVHYSADYRFFDANTLNELETPSIYGKYKNADFADKVIRMNYDIHIGAIGGLAGKVIAFISSLIIASLPITGILLWYGRKYKAPTSRKENAPQGYLG